MAVALFSSLLLVVCVAKCAKERVRRCVYTMMQAFYHVGVLPGSFLWEIWEVKESDWWESFGKS